MAGENQDELRDAALFAFNPETGGDLADGLEAGPVVALLQPVDIGADDCAPVLDPRPWPPSTSVAADTLACGSSRKILTSSNNVA